MSEIRANFLFFILFQGCLVSNLRFTYAEDRNAPSTPNASMIELHMAGALTDKGVVELNCGVVLPGENATAVNMNAFEIIRTADNGKTTRMPFVPDFKAATGPDAATHKSFSYIDKSIESKVTYRYVCIYSSDVQLSSCPVVINGAANAVQRPQANTMSVEICGTSACNGGTVLMLMARCNRAGANFKWSTVEPHMSTILAQHGSRALIRTPEGAGYGHGAIRVDCQLGGESCSAYYVPSIVYWAFVQVVEQDPEVLHKLKAMNDAGKTKLRELLTSAFAADKTDSVDRMHVKKTLRLAGKAVMPGIRTYYDEMQDQPTRFALMSLMGDLDPDYVFDNYLDSSIGKEDIATFVHALLSATEVAERRQKEYLAAMGRCLESKNGFIRHMAIERLGRSNLETALPLLERVRDTDTNDSLRFLAACSINEIRTGDGREIPDLPEFGSEEMRPREVRLARELYSQALAEMKVPSDVTTKTDFIVLGGGQGESTSTEKLNFPGDSLKANSAIAKFAVMGQAGIPIMAKRFLNRHIAEHERSMIEWVLNKCNLRLPDAVESQLISAFVKAPPNERESILNDFAFLKFRKQESEHGSHDPEWTFRPVAEMTLSEKMDAMNKIKYWAMAFGNGDLPSALEKFEAQQMQWFGLLSMHFTADGKYLALETSGDEGIRVWSVEEKKEIWAHQAHLKENESSYRNFDFSCPHYMTCYASENNISVRRVWDVRTGERRTLPEGQASPDGKYWLATRGKNVEVREMVSQQVVATFTPKKRGVAWVYFSLDSRFVAIPCTGGYVTLYSLEKMQPVAELPQNAEHFQFSSDGRYVAMAVGSNLVVCETKDGREVVNVPIEDGEFYTRFAARNRIVLSTSKSAKVIDVAKPGEPVCTVGPFSGFDLTPDGRLLYGFIKGEHEMVVHDTTTGKQLAKFDAHGMHVNAYPSGIFTLRNKVTNQIQLLDPASFKEMGSFTPIHEEKNAGRDSEDHVAANEGQGLLAFATEHQIEVWQADKAIKLFAADLKPLSEKPTKTRDHIVLQLLREIQSGQDAAAEYAREKWPLTRKP